MADPYRPSRFDAAPQDPEQRAALASIARTLDRLLGAAVGSDAGPPSTGFLLVYFPLEGPIDRRAGFICNANNCPARMNEALQQLREELGGVGGPAGHA